MLQMLITIANNQKPEKVRADPVKVATELEKVETGKVVGRLRGFGTWVIPI